MKYTIYYASFLCDAIRVFDVFVCVVRPTDFNIIEEFNQAII